MKFHRTKKKIDPFGLPFRQITSPIMLFTIASEICWSNDLPFHIPNPLKKKTVQNWILPPFDAQTGPPKEMILRPLQKPFKST